MKPPRAPVVLLHALGLDASMWDGQRAALVGAGYAVIGVNQRGFGGTRLGGHEPSLDLVADDLARLLDARGTGRVALVGSSMGGYVAMAFLRRYPERVGALVLMSTRAAADTGPEREAFARAVTDERTRPALLAAAIPTLVGATTRARRPEVYARVAAAVRAAPPESLAWAQRAVAGRPDSTGTLRAARVPALVVAGAEDELVDAHETQELAATLPCGRLVTVPGAGHLAPLEQPSVVSDALLALLGEWVRPAGTEPT